MNDDFMEIPDSRFEEVPRDQGKAPAKPKRLKRAFNFVHFDKTEIVMAPPYLIQGLIPRIGLTVVWGPPKCGKSFLVFDMAMHVALGWEYRGRSVQRGVVVYCALEGAHGFRNRIAAFRTRFLAEEHDDVPFYLMSEPLHLVKEHPEFIESLKLMLGDKKPAAIIIDTLSRSFQGSESDDEAMRAYTDALDALRDTFRCAIVLVHHSGLDATRMRGHTALPGALDAEISVKKGAAGGIIATLELLKDGDEGASFASKLETVTVGQDTDGDDITSCVVLPDGDGASASARKAGAKLTKGAKIALSALHEVLAESGMPAPASNHIPNTVKVVTIDQWRQRAYSRGISTSDKADARRISFSRATEALVAAKVVGIWEDNVWNTAVGA